MEIAEKILVELRKGPSSWRKLVEHFPRKHPEAVERAIYSLSRQGKIFPLRQGVFKVVTPDMTEEDYIDLTDRYKDADNDALEAHGLKRCTHCRHVKPLEDYYIQKRDYGGHRPDCKECVKARVTARRASKTEAELAWKASEPKSKTCRCCGQEKPITQFHLQKATEYRTAYRRSYCRSCVGARLKEFNEKVAAGRKIAREAREAKKGAT